MLWYHRLKVKHTFFLDNTYTLGEFAEKDFDYEDCEEINSAILEEAKTFVTFMQTIIEEVVGKEDEMMNILTGKINLATLGRRPKSILDDDDEDEEWNLNVDD